MLGAVSLTSQQARVLGSLAEKQLATPQQYPLTLPALVAACNQSSNRDPVVSYDEHTVMTALNDLKDARLVRFVLPSQGRSAVRYRHVLDEAWGIDARQIALLAVLLLRGPQTFGELRIRTDRMAEFAVLGEIEHELGYMSTLDPSLALNIGRRPGQKEERWACPLITTPPVAESNASYGTDAVAASRTQYEPPHGLSENSDRLERLESEVGELRAEVAELQGELRSLRESLGE
jgi:uncharacterized protein YceH (UPF0502 family)